MKLLGGIGAAGLLFVSLGLSSAYAGPITVANASFETPDLNVPGGHTVGAPASWTGSGSQFGVIQPDSTFYTAGSDGLPGAAIVPDGDQAAYLLGTSSLSQTLSAVFEADTIYTLDVFVGHRSRTTYPATKVDISLFAGGTLLSTTTVADPGQGDWIEASLTFASGSSDLFLGQSITIVLDQVATSSGQSTNFDDVSLLATPCRGRCSVPEPDSISIFLAGLAGLGALGGVLRLRRRTGAL